MSYNELANDYIINGPPIITIYAHRLYYNAIK